MPAIKTSSSASTQSKKAESAPTNNITNRTTDLFIESATEINVIIDKVNKLNDEMMSTFDTLHDAITRNFGIFQTRFTELEAQLQTAQAENQDHRDAANTFNRVSMLKKQDIQIRQDQIKIAELESRIKFLEKENIRLSSPVNNQPVNPTPSVAKPIDRIEDEAESYCNARLGKKKFKVSNQAAGFMDDYPEDVFVTDTGCVIGQACNEPIPHGEAFCTKHSNGKFEDIRKAPIDTVPATQKAPEPAKIEEPVKKVAEPIDEEDLEEEAHESESVKKVTEPVKEDEVEEEKPVKKAPEPVKKVVEPVDEEELEDEVEEEPVKKASEPVKNVVEPVKKVVSNNIDSTAAPPVMIPDIDKDNIDIHTLADGTSYYINLDTNDLFEMTENDDIGVFVGKLNK